MKKLRILSSILPSKLYLKLVFWLYHHEFLNLKNPSTLNEKIQHLKLFNFRPFHTLVADKFLVREYIAEKIGTKHLIELYDHYKDPRKIMFDKLPNSFVMKSNHGSAQVKIVKDKNSENLDELRQIAQSWLIQDYSSVTKEKQYYHIKRKILFEKLLLNQNGNPPEDYKFHCFNGSVEFIQVDTDRFTNHSRNFYTTSWQNLPFSWSPWKRGRPKYPVGQEIKEPQNVQKMISIAETLSADFHYCRIDLYNLKGVIYFGEITLHHESGWARFHPKHFDKTYGLKLEWPI